MYWILMPQRSHEEQLSLDELPPLFAETDISFCVGNAILQQFSVIDIPYSNEFNSSFTDNLVAAPTIGLLINSKIRNLFDQLNIDNIQYFKARLIDEDTQEVNHDYWLANIVGKRWCVDKSLSELDLFDDGDIRFIDKLVLSLDKNTYYGHIFRMEEFISLLVISDELKMALEDSGVTGFGIYKPEEFSL